MTIEFDIKCPNTPVPSSDIRTRPANMREFCVGLKTHKKYGRCELHDLKTVSDIMRFENMQFWHLDKAELKVIIRKYV